MTKPRIRLGISPCPNDTFAFAALMDRRVDWRGLDFQIELIDIQQLNDRLFRGDFDVAKTSFHAALRMTEQTVVLPSGSARVRRRATLARRRTGSIPKRRPAPKNHSLSRAGYDGNDVVFIVLSRHVPSRTVRFLGNHAATEAARCRFRRLHS